MCVGESDVFTDRTRRKDLALDYCVVATFVDAHVAVGASFITIQDSGILSVIVLQDQEAELPVGSLVPV